MARSQRSVSSRILQMNATLAWLADSVKDLATKASVKELIEEGVKDLATKASVEATVKEGVRKGPRTLLQRSS